MPPFYNKAGPDRGEGKTKTKLCFDSKLGLFFAVL